MREWLRQWSIRSQLWALLGVFLVSGLGALILDEVEHRRTRQTLRHLQRDTLPALHLTRTVADAYGVDLIETTARVRNGSVDWEQGAARIDAAQRRAAQAWSRLQALPRSPEEETHWRDAAQARRIADAATAELRRILHRHDAPALGRFADTRLYASIDPLQRQLDRLSALARARADAGLRQGLTNGERTNRWQSALLLFALVCVVAVGGWVLRNAHRTIGNLTRLSHRLREHDYDALPDEPPQGELAMVMDAFLDMRRDMHGFESELTGQLIRNERLRAELAQQAGLSSALLDTMQAAIVVAGPDGRIRRFNAHAERLLGWRAEDLAGREPLQRLFESRGLQHLAKELTTASRNVDADWTALRELGRQGAPPRELRLRHRNGAAVAAWVAVRALREDSGLDAGVLVVAHDPCAARSAQAAAGPSETAAPDERPRAERERAK